jgi:hypothetical protein
VRNRLANSYICHSDEYIVENPFRAYEFRSYLSTFESTPTARIRAVQTNRKGEVTGMRHSNGWFLRGPAYLNRTDSQHLMDILAEEFDYPETHDKLWDTIFLEHATEFHAVTKRWKPGEIYEFNQLQDLLAFDRDFLQNVDSQILDNICTTLDCTREDITDVDPLKAGLTNLSVLFSCKGVRYVYRHPGAGTDEIINRQAETFSLGVAKRLGLDETFIFENPEEGWKISRYIEGCTEFDYQDPEQVKRALQLAKRLHESDEVSPWSFDFYEETMNIIGLLEELSYPMPSDFDGLLGSIQQLEAAMAPDRGKPCLCHNDFYGPNFLVRGDDMWLIDWEYAAMGD